MMLTGGNNAKETIVCDVGAYQFRGGYAGDATPVAFPTTLGYVFDSVEKVQREQKELLATWRAVVSLAAREEPLLALSRLMPP